MGVDRGEVELAGNEEQHGAHCGKTGVAAGFTFGRLEEAIEGLDEAVGLTSLGPGDDAVEVSADHAGDVLHRRDLGAQDIGAPVLEHGGDDVDLLAVEDGAQAFAVEPGAGGAFGGGVADQGIEVGARFGRQPLTVLEQCPAQTFEAGIAALFKPPGLIEGGRGVGDDMEFIKGDARLGQVVGDAPDEGRRHVDAHCGDLLGSRFVRGHVLGKAGDGRGVASLGREHHLAFVSIDMSPAFIKGVTKHLPNARITFDKFHIVAHASKAVDQTRRSEQKTDPSLKGLRWALLKDRERLPESQRVDLDAFVAQATTKRTARAWLYREQLRDILDRKQINVVSAMLKRWCANVKRSKVQAMKKVAQMILDHFEGVTAWAQTRQTNGFLEAINGLFQAAKRKARGYGRFQTMRTVIYLVAGNLNFSAINSHVMA